MHDLLQIGKVKDSLISQIQEKFPKCNYTVVITLWDDSTFQVECRHAQRINKDCVELHKYLYYDGTTNYSKELLNL